MEEYKLAQEFLNKNKKNSNTKNSNKKIFYSLLNRTLLSFLLLVICLCVIKINDKAKNFIEKNVYNTNLSFSKINNIYEKYLGKISPLPDITKSNTETVFNESLSYSNKEKYKDGVKLTVDNNYLVPILESGIVVYMGNKDNYGYTIIIEQVNGIDLWYVGVKNTNYKLYEYVEKGSLLGEASSNEIYLYYQKDGEFIDYQEYLG